MFGGFQTAGAYFGQPPATGFIGKFWRLATNNIIKPLAHALRRVKMNGRIDITATDENPDTVVSADKDL